MNAILQFDGRVKRPRKFARMTRRFAVQKLTEGKPYVMLPFKYKQELFFMQYYPMLVQGVQPYLEVGV